MELLDAPNRRNHLANHMTALLNDLGDRILPADRPAPLPPPPRDDDYIP
jgi:hypothetical protein